MKVNRKELFQTLNSVTPGLASKEVLEQSGSFIFKDGYVLSFNDEITVRAELDLGIQCAIPAQKLIQLLAKMNDDEVTITMKNTKFMVKGKNKKAEIAIQEEITLPLDQIELPKKFKHKVPEEFIPALVGSTITCSKDMTRPILTCSHVVDGMVESCDNFRASRYTIPTFGEEFMIPFGVTNHLKDYTIQKMALTDNWVHFQCKGKVIFSFRRLAESYPDLEGAGLFKHKGSKFKIPKTLNETLERAGIFSKADFEQDETVELSIVSGVMKVHASDETSSYEETLKCKAKANQDITFEIHPKFLAECDSDAIACIGENTLSIKTDNFQYIALLSVQEDEDGEDGE